MYWDVLLQQVAARTRPSWSKVCNGRAAGGVAVQPVAQGAGGLDVVAVVGEEPVPGGTGRAGAGANGLVVADHRLAAAGILDRPGESGQRGHVLEPGRAA